MDWTLTQLGVDFMQNQATLVVYRSATLTMQAATVSVSFPAADKQPLDDAARRDLTARAKQVLIDAATALESLPMTQAQLARECQQPLLLFGLVLPVIQSPSPAARAVE